MNAQTPIVADSSAPAVFTAIAAVMEDMSREGIGKDRKNTQQGYNFRGIDDVYNALAPILAKHRLVITPRCLHRACEQRASAKGGVLFNVTVEVEFTLTSANDGSTVTAVTYGEAMDSADKATNKAMSAAYKYMAMQTFCIPTEGDNDADATTHQLASAEELAINLLRGCASDKALFKEAWEKNKAGWKGVMDGPAYQRVVVEMKRIAAAFPKDEPKPPPAEGFALDDEIPEFN